MLKIQYIVATYNIAPFVDRFLINLQKFEKLPIEFLIVDGGSCDGSVEKLLNKKNVKIVTSEPDNGIYDAWNKAIAHVSAPLVGFLGADDIIGYDFIDTVLKLSDTQAVFHYGNYQAVNGNKHRDVYVGEIKDLNCYLMNCPYLPFAHPGTLISTHILKAIKFDDTYELAGDLDFFIRALKIYEIKVQYHNVLQVKFDTHGKSNSFSAYKIYAKEFKKIAKSYNLNYNSYIIKHLLISNIIWSPLVFQFLKSIKWSLR